jgi:cation transport ATPase
VTHVFIDKTGTLTEDRLQLREVLPGPHATQPVARSQALAASLAGWSQHPLSRALASAAEAPPTGLAGPG